jgi:hypothetical protein
MSLVKNNIILNKTAKNSKSVWILLPVFGTLLFLILYILATFLYPGGSQIDKNAIGFSWINNYWCNLLDKQAINGAYNPARPVALTGMLILCLTLSTFWYLFPKNLATKKAIKKIIQISGIISMSVALFLFTKFHDLVTNLASFFGVIALVGTFLVLYEIKWFSLFRFGIFNFLLVGLNNYVYYTKGLIVFLPLIQKISFASFLIWICCISITLHRKIKENTNHH